MPVIRLAVVLSAIGVSPEPRVSQSVPAVQALGPVRFAAPFAREGWEGEGTRHIRAREAFSAELRSDANSAAQVVARCPLQPGGEVPYARLLLRVLRGVEFAARRAILLPSATTTVFGPIHYLDRDTYLRSRDNRDVEIPVDARLEYLAYYSEGSCLYRYNKQVFETGCMNAIDGRDPKPVHERWILTSCSAGSGWLNIDAVKARLTLDLEPPR